MGKTSEWALIDNHNQNVLWVNIEGRTVRSNPEMGRKKNILDLKKLCKIMET